MNVSNSTVKMVLSAMFAALICVATMIIRVPTVGTSGYVNIGDATILLAVWILGGPFAAVAAGVGSAMADLLAGYSTYVPGTFVIKFAMAIAAYLVYKLLTKFAINKYVVYIISGLVAEAVMVGGYLAYEWVLLGYGAGALPSVGSNIAQGTTCIVLAVVAIGALDASKVSSKIKKLGKA